MPRHVYRNPIQPNSITLRDPFIMRHPNGYYLYGTTRGADGEGFDAWFSRDLLNWSFTGEVYEKPDSATWNELHFAGPEVHDRNGRFYMFYSAGSKAGFKGIGVAVANSPLGPFFDAPYNPITPDDRDFRDPHLYTDPGGTHWLFFTDEWTSVGTETLYVQKLTNDLTHAVGSPEPVVRADEVDWITPLTSEAEGTTGRIIEAAHLLVGDDGTHYLMCTTRGENGCCVGYLTADELAGPYESRGVLIHGGASNCVLTAPDGKTQLTAYYRPDESSGGGGEHLYIDELLMPSAGTLVVDQSMNEDRVIEVP